jgi:molybdopterin converting factor small subunit
MQVSVQLFALARQRAGRSPVVVDIPAPGTVRALESALALTVPELAPLIPILRFAVNAEYVERDHIIPPGAEVAAIPPVSGGSQKHPCHSASIAR